MQMQKTDPGGAIEETTPESDCGPSYFAQFFTYFSFLLKNCAQYARKLPVWMLNICTDSR